MKTTQVPNFEYIFGFYLNSQLSIFRFIFHPNFVLIRAAYFYILFSMAVYVRVDHSKP